MLQIGRVVGMGISAPARSVGARHGISGRVDGFRDFHARHGGGVHPEPVAVDFQVERSLRRDAREPHVEFRGLHIEMDVADRIVNAGDGVEGVFGVGVGPLITLIAELSGFRIAFLHKHRAREGGVAVKERCGAILFAGLIGGEREGIVGELGVGRSRDMASEGDERVGGISDEEHGQHPHREIEAPGREIFRADHQQGGEDGDSGADHEMPAENEYSGEIDRGENRERHQAAVVAFGGDEEGENQRSSEKDDIDGDAAEGCPAEGVDGEELELRGEGDCRGHHADEHASDGGERKEEDEDE